MDRRMAEAATRMIIDLIDNRAARIKLLAAHEEAEDEPILPSLITNASEQEWPLLAHELPGDFFSPSIEYRIAGEISGVENLADVITYAIKRGFEAINFHLSLIKGMKMMVDENEEHIIQRLRHPSRKGKSSRDVLAITGIELIITWKDWEDEVAEQVLIQHILLPDEFDAVVRAAERASQTGPTSFL